MTTGGFSCKTHFFSVSNLKYAQKLFTQNVRNQERSGKTALHDSAYYLCFQSVEKEQPVDPMESYYISYRPLAPSSQNKESQDREIRTHWQELDYCTKPCQMSNGIQVLAFWTASHVAKPNLRLCTPGELSDNADFKVATSRACELILRLV